MTLACPTAKGFLAQAAPGWPTPLDFMPLDFVVVGLNHQTAPVEVRERAAVRPGETGPLLEKLARSAREVMLLSTCNRTEIYLAGVQGRPTENDAAESFAALWGPGLHEHLYMYQGTEAARHLYRVAAGLDSLVVGETQIQGQVKRAWQEASALGYSGTVLNKVAQGALAAGKRVRFETGMSDKVVSVSSAAVELAESALGDLTGRTALIVGAGETAELTLTHLQAAGVSDIVVVNRTHARAQQLANKLGGRTCAYDLLAQSLPEADVVIASSAAPHYVLRGQDVAAALTQRRHSAGLGQNMVLIDISVPRILSPDIAQVSGAHLYNLDDLTEIVSRNMQSRRAALPYAEAIVREAAADLSRWHLTRQAQHRQLVSR